MMSQSRPGTQADTVRPEAIRDYWNTHIHDLEITSHPVGSPDFFQDLETYRFNKLHYLPKIIDFSAYRGCRILEIGCGTGVDLVRFAHGGALAAGVDFSITALMLAQKNFEHNSLKPDLFLMDGEMLGFKDSAFDMVYANGVLQYTSQPERMVAEVHRILRPGGKAIFMMYNKYSWLNAMSHFLKVKLEHEDAPVFTKVSQSDFRWLLHAFDNVEIIPERFPVKTELHRGWKASLYNQVFVPLFNLLPHALIKPFGWHLIACAKKGQ
jgi:SAM-dependent methyltransferase